MKGRLGLSLACVAQTQDAGLGGEGGTNSKEKFKVFRGRT